MSDDAVNLTAPTGKRQPLAALLEDHRRHRAERAHDARRFELLVQAREWLRHGGGGKTWNSVDGRPEMASDMAEWVLSSVSLAADLRVGRYGYKAALKARKGAAELPWEFAREMVKAAAAKDTEKVGQLAVDAQAAGVTQAIYVIFSDACDRVACAFGERWESKTEVDTSELADVLRAVERRVGDHANRFRPKRQPDVDVTHNSRRDIVPTAEAEPPPRRDNSPPTTIAELREWSDKNLSGKQRIAAMLMCDGGGKYPIADMAVADGIKWNCESIGDGFRGIRRALNEQFRPLGWSVIQRDRCATLVNRPTAKPKKRTRKVCQK